MLCSARAFWSYMYPVAVVAVGFAVAGVTAVAVTAFGVLLCLLGFSVARVVGASRAGKRWKARNRDKSFDSY